LRGDAEKPRPRVSFEEDGAVPTAPRFEEDDRGQVFGEGRVPRSPEAEAQDGGRVPFEQDAERIGISGLRSAEEGSVRPERRQGDHLSLNGRPDGACAKKR
jgi:hypothetical protein